MRLFTKLLLNGVIIGEVKVLSREGNEILLELNIPVYDDKPYQIELDDNLFNLKFSRIDGDIQKGKEVYFQANATVFK